MTKGAELVTNPSGVEIGEVLGGKYRIDRILGQGGMGIVVKATHLQLYQPVAIKFLLPEVLANQQVVQRFMREAQAAVRLKSEHVARVIDVGSREAGAPYMVLEYLEGVDLSNFPRPHLSVGAIIDLMLQACEALAEAHSLGIVHRDIKPANFFITRRSDGTLLLKVLDFGISKIAATGGQLTVTQAVMGTPAYMSPEQMRSSRDVDHRTDIWSLGVVLYELVQGAPPFGGDTFSSMVLKVVTEPIPRLAVPLPGDLDAIIYRCLEKDPARRFQDIAEVAQAIAKYAQSATQAAVSVQRTRGTIGAKAPGAVLEPGPTPRAQPSTLSGSAGVLTMPRRRGPPWPAVSLLVAAGLLAAVVAVAIARGGSDANPQVILPAAPGGSAAAEPHRQSTVSGAVPASNAVPASDTVPASDAVAASGAVPASDAMVGSAAIVAPTPPDAGIPDAMLVASPVDAAVLSPHRQKPVSKSTRQPSQGEDHAKPSGSATPPVIDRGD